MKSQSPFLDVSSYTMEETSPEVTATSAAPTVTPFLELYGSDDAEGFIDPESEEYVAFLNELYDEEFDVAIASLLDEASAIYETNFLHEDPQINSYQAERLLDQHFAPLMAETEAMFGSLAREFGGRDPNTLSQEELEAIVDRYSPAIELTPSFENFFGALKNIVKKVASKTVDLAKKGVQLAARFGLGPILEKLKALIHPLLKQVIRTAIGKLPPQLQPIARKLAERMPFLKELEELDEAMSEATASYGTAEIQYEFNQGVANLVFARSEVEQDLEVARALTENAVPETYPLAELDHSRENFVHQLQNLREGEDPTPYVENFLPAILPALRIGLSLIGRNRVVDFLAKLLGKLINKFVGPQYTPALSRAIVNAGLHLLQLETTPQDESRAAASAVAATVEDTIRRVATAPEYILDNQELLEGFALEAFEQAAAANLPPVLPEETYRKRPELGEARKLRGVWVMMPRGIRKRYKKYCQRIATRLTPHKVSAFESSDDNPVSEFLEEQLGIEPGEEVEAFVHLYEAIPGTRLADIVRQEEIITKMEGASGYGQLHPLTREAAALLLDEPELGRDAGPQHFIDPHAPQVGERFYYLEVPGKRLLMVPGPTGKATVRRPTGVRLILDFPKNEIRIYKYLSEIRAQELAVKLRQHSHTGVVMARLRRSLQRGLRRALFGASGHLKIIHEAVTPNHWAGALQRLPSTIPQALLGKLTEWVIIGLSDHLKKHSEELLKAAEEPLDGVTMVITLENPPGLPQLRQALKGKVFPPGGLKLSDGAPIVKIKVSPGYMHE